MPIVFLLSIALQVACSVHVARSGRPLYWIWLILIGSYLAVMVYALVAIIPGLRDDPRDRKAVSRTLQIIDPQRRRRELQRQPELSNTVDNRRRLAQESWQLGDYDSAQELYHGLLTGMYPTEPDFMLGLAQAQVGQGNYAASSQTLEVLIKANPGHKSSDGHR